MGHVFFLTFMVVSTSSSSPVLNAIRSGMAASHVSALALACIGVGLSGTASAQWTDTVYCANIPEEIVFKRHRDVSVNKTLNKRLERYPGSSVFVEKHKNAAQRGGHGPAFIRNCAIRQAATHWISFKFKTTDFYGTDIGSHLAFLLRGRFVAPVTLNSERVPDRALDDMKYTGRGLAIFPLLTGQPHISGATVEGFQYRRQHGNL